MPCPPIPPHTHPHTPIRPAPIPPTPIPAPTDDIVMVQQQPTPNTAPPTTSNRQRITLQLRGPPKDLYASDYVSRMIPRMPGGQALALLCDLAPDDATALMQQLQTVRHGVVGGWWVGL